MSSPKVTTTTGTKAAPLAKAMPVAEVSIKVSASIAALISPLASADAAASAAVSARERQVIKFATTLAKDPMAKAGRVACQKALKPLFVEAYAKSGKDEAYAGQQLSRVLVIAFGPASDKLSAKEREKIAANTAKAIANNAETQTIIGMAGGRLTYAKGDKIAKVEKSRGGSGGSNRKTPLETFNASAETAVTAATQGNVPPLAILIGVLSALVACEAIDQEEADAIEAAAKKAL